MQGYQLIKTEQKALDINLNAAIYGTFAEIGAGQEVARNFFQVGAAANTIAKTMSAYDKTYSDAIYGVEPSGRYICESRLYKMLEHEWQLLEERLASVRPNSSFFVFADTVTTINYSKTIKGQGWMGLRFRLGPNREPNEMVIHVKLLDTEAKLQQDAIGILGVNLIYACYYHHQNPEQMVVSLLDGLEGRATVDMVRVTGPDFEHLDHRILSLYLVTHKLTEVAIFDHNKRNVHASEFLYKKSLMVVRGNYKPPTLVSDDVINASFQMFHDEHVDDTHEAALVCELTLDNLKNSENKIDVKDFLARTDCLCAMGYKVLVSNCTNHQILINYMSDYKIKNLGLVIGVRELLEIINDKFEENQDGRLLVAFGELFTRNIKIYAYPAREKDGELLTAKNLPVPEGITFLYRYLLESKQIVEVVGFDDSILHIYPKVVIDHINADNKLWKEMVPQSIVSLIETKGLFKTPKEEVIYQY